MINLILLFSMFLLGGILVVLKFWFFSAVVFVSFAFGILLSWVMEKAEFKPCHKTLIYIFLWLSIVGELGLYVRWDIYDKLLHLIIPFFLAYLVGFYLRKSEIKHKGFIIFFVVLGMGSIFEVFEYLIDSFLGMNMGGVTNLSKEILMDEWKDTIWDLIMTSCGILIYLICSSITEKERV